MPAKKASGGEARTKAPRPRRDAAHAREAVLEAALRRFSSHGYAGARVSDIARDAGYSEALVYFHFKNKVQLFREVVSRIDAESGWFDEQTSAEHFVDQMREGELRYHRDARWRALDRVWAEALAGNRDLLELIRPQLHHSAGAMEALLARLDQSEQADHHKLALFLMAMSYGTRVLRRYDPDALSPEEAADLMGFAAEVVTGRLSAED